MQTHTLRLVTIVAESALERRLVDDVRRLGASGFTVTDARGEGTRQSHAGELPGANVRVEAVVPPAVADRILAHLAGRYFADYSLIAWTSEVAVVRSRKYDAPAAAAPA